ncbi:MAG: type I restriction enzyme HsdR N-terminal domain-containing protein [Flavobacteriaceae bacterium]|nr:type I restriction enzyme HsdR N-terminal domain-containing protein [Flavobacteriaceae bacterium]
MDLKDELNRQLVSYKKRKQKDEHTSEANTKMWFINPFLGALGYRHTLCFQEYDPDPNAKKPDKVDYALLKDGKPIIFVEAIPLDENLGKYHSRLKKYFNVNKDVEFGILTNGNEYQFYTDIEDKNQLDETPFLIFCLEEIDNEIRELLLQFSVENYNFGRLKKLATKRKHLSELERQFISPEDKFVRAISKCIFGSQRRSYLDLSKEIILMFGSKLPNAKSFKPIEDLEPTLPEALSPSPTPQSEVNFFELGDLTGKKISSYTWEGQPKVCKNWSALFQEICIILYNQDKEKFLQVNEKMYSFHKLVSDKSRYRISKHISDNLYIGIDSSTHYKKADLERLLESFEKKDSLYITLSN